MKNLTFLKNNIFIRDGVVTIVYYRKLQKNQKRNIYEPDLRFERIGYM